MTAELEPGAGSRAATAALRRLSSSCWASSSAIRRRRGPARRRPDPTGGRAVRDRRALGVGQVDAAAHHGNARTGDERARTDRRRGRLDLHGPRAGRSTRQPDRLRLSTVPSARGSHRARERGRRAALHGHAGPRAAPPGAGGARAGRTQPSHRAHLGVAVRRRAPTRGDRPGARQRAGDRARRRAHRQPRQRHRSRDPRAAPDAERAGHNRRRHHPRARDRGHAAAAGRGPRRSPDPRRAAAALA